MVKHNRPHNQLATARVQTSHLHMDSLIFPKKQRDSLKIARGNSKEKGEGRKSRKKVETPIEDSRAAIL